MANPSMGPCSPGYNVKRPQFETTRKKGEYVIDGRWTVAG